MRVDQLSWEQTYAWACDSWSTDDFISISWIICSVFNAPTVQNVAADFKKFGVHILLK